jgi:hypothetical protein
MRAPGARPCVEGAVPPAPNSVAHLIPEPVPASQRIPLNPIGRVMREIPRLGIPSGTPQLHPRSANEYGAWVEPRPPRSRAAAIASQSSRQSPPRTPRVRNSKTNGGRGSTRAPFSRAPHSRTIPRFPTQTIPRCRIATKRNPHRHRNRKPFPCRPHAPMGEFRCPNGPRCPPQREAHKLMTT